MTTLEDVRLAWAHWQAAKDALQAASEGHLDTRTVPSDREAAVEARAAYARWWRLAGEYGAEQGDKGFRARQGGYWQEPPAPLAKVLPGKPKSFPLPD